MSEILKELPYTNTGKTDAHVGGKVIKPGHTRMVEATQHPDYHKHAAAAAAAAGESAGGKKETAEPSKRAKRTAELKALLAMAGGMPAITKDIGDGEKYTAADFKELRDLEYQARKPRTSLIQLFEQLLLKRASEEAGSGGGEGILGMLEGEDVAAGITAADDLTIEDLDELDTAESDGKKRADVLLAIEGKITQIRTAAAKDILAQPDQVKAIAEAELSLADLDLLEQVETESPSPRNEVAQAIDQKRESLKDKGGILSGLKGLLGKGK